LFHIIAIVLRYFSVPSVWPAGVWGVVAPGARRGGRSGDRGSASAPRVWVWSSTCRIQRSLPTEGYCEAG